MLIYFYLFTHLYIFTFTYLYIFIHLFTISYCKLVMVLFKELCCTFLLNAFHLWPIVVWSILLRFCLKTKKNKTKNQLKKPLRNPSTKFHQVSLKKPNPQKPQPKKDLLSLQNFPTFPRMFMPMYRASPASPAQGKKQQNNTHKLRQPSAQQTSRQHCRRRTTHHIIHAFERKTKHPQVFLSTVPTPVPMERNITQRHG